MRPRLGVEARQAVRCKHAAHSVAEGHQIDAVLRLPRLAFGVAVATAVAALGRRRHVSLCCQRKEGPCALVICEHLWPPHAYTERFLLPARGGEQACKGVGEAGNAAAAPWSGECAGTLQPPQRC